MSAREDIAAAASTVDGINVSPTIRESTKVGDGWLRLNKMTRADNGYGFINTWDIFIVVPQDNASAETWLDENAGLLEDALHRELYVTTITPTSISLETSGTSVWAVHISGTREN